MPGTSVWQGPLYLRRRREELDQTWRCRCICDSLLAYSLITNNHAIHYNCQTNNEILTDVFLNCGQWFVASKVILILRCLFEMMTWKRCERKQLWAERTLCWSLHVGTPESVENTYVNMVLRSRFEPNTLRVNAWTLLPCHSSALSCVRKYMSVSLFVELIQMYLYGINFNFIKLCRLYTTNN